MKKPTTKDAEILLDFLRLTNTPETREAFEWFTKDFSAKNNKEFKAKYPVGSKEFNHVSTILSTFEIAGVLISHDLLNENLYFDTSGIEFIWGRLAPLIPAWQKESGPALWENAVWLAERQKRWKKKVWKPNMKWKNGK